MQKSLPIISDNNTKVLIIGTVPGKTSLEKQEYYSNKSNRFCKIIFDFIDCPIPQTYIK